MLLGYIVPWEIRSSLTHWTDEDEIWHGSYQQYASCGIKADWNSDKLVELDLQ